MRPIRCIVFDMDGTLTDTHRLIFDAFNHIVEAYGGKRMTDAEIAALFGPPEEGALIPIVGEHRIEEAMTRYLEFYHRHHASLASVYNGMPELVTELRERGIRLALFTGKGRHTTRISLEAIGLSDAFERVVTGNDVKEHKPSGEGLHRIMRELGVDPEETLMVGDSRADVRAAHDAGVPVALVRWDEHTRHREIVERPDFQFDTVAAFAAWIRAAIRPA